MRRSIGYECQVEGSCTKDVDEFITRAKRTLARERAERKAKPELAKAETTYQDTTHPDRPLWRSLQELRRKLAESLESITQPGDEQKAREMCAQKLRGFRRSAEEHVRAALEAGRAPILAKATALVGCGPCSGSGKVGKPPKPCPTCAGTGKVKGPWHGKTIQFIGQSKVTEMVRDDGLVTLVGEWSFEVSL